jgi:pimeloyl-ACP methyl ester carboxylesterase
MLETFSRIVTVIYLALPPLTLWMAARRAKQARRAAPMLGFVMMAVAGIAVGSLVLILNAVACAGRVTWTEFVQTVYLTVGALCVLRWVDRGLLRLAFRLARVRTDMVRFPLRGTPPRAVIALFCQRLVLLALAAPYALALLCTYRPQLRTIEQGDPASRLGATFEAVQLAASDGVRISAWWIDASEPPMSADEAPQPHWGRDAVVLVPGWGGRKEHLVGTSAGPAGRGLAGVLIAGGWNVLAIDPRAHGGSSGRLCSFGDHERHDVLGAVRWLKANRPQASHRVFVLGMNTGAAAALAAATEGGDGQAIDGVVLCEPFADLDSLVQSNCDRVLPQPVSALVANLSLPIASLHSGADLTHFRPADYSARLWPRPLLVVYGRDESLVPLAQQMGVYPAALGPKAQYWPTDNYTQRRSRDGNLSCELTKLLRQITGVEEGGMANDPGAQQRTIRFLQQAQPIPAL